MAGRVQERSLVGRVGAMRLAELLDRAGVQASVGEAGQVAVTGVTDDSRQVRGGSVFVAVAGRSVDGHDLVEEAVRAGASVVVTERPMSLPEGVVGLVVGQTRMVLGRLAAAFYGLDELQRSGRLRVIGVTGTNGKSTFCYLARAILEEAGHRTAMLGTIEYDLVSRRMAAPMTTPPAVQLVQYLVEAARAGATHVVMEVSSHALDQGRTEGIGFSVGVFTNLSGDHLDYHEDMEGYLRAKRRLFEALGPEGWAIVNRDDAAAGRLLERCRSRVLGFGLEGGAEVGARIRRMELAGSSFELISAGGRVAVRTALMGRHNVLNALAAAATGVALGIDLETIRRGLEKVDRVPGRLERVGPEGGPITVLVDYAHSDDALRNVLEALRPIKRGRLIVVFGCGGERDRSKRPRMGRVACALGDVVIVTSDNPRGERPQAIIDEILAGIEGWGMERVEVEPERRKAIWRAVELADEGDVVVIAGKGHERYQVVAGRRLPFDDVAVAAGAVRRRLGSGQ